MRSSMLGVALAPKEDAAPPAGMSTVNPDAFYHAKESVTIALTQLHATFRGSHAALAKVLAAAKLNIEDAGLFE